MRYVCVCWSARACVFARAHWSESRSCSSRQVSRYGVVSARKLLFLGSLAVWRMVCYSHRESVAGGAEVRVEVGVRVEVVGG